MAKWVHCDTCDSYLDPDEVLGIGQQRCQICGGGYVNYVETYDGYEGHEDIATGGLAPFLIAEAKERERIASAMFIPVGWVWEYMGDTHFSTEKPNLGVGNSIPVPFQVYRKVQ